MLRSEALVRRAVTVTTAIFIRGGCKVTVYDDDFEHGERPVGTLNADDYFGEVALLEGAQKRTANVITIERTVTMSFNRDLFNEFLLEFRSQLMEHAALRWVASNR